MMQPHYPWKSAIASIVLVLTATSAFAQDGGGVKWRTDYNSARKEADAKNRPVLIDFVRPGCLPCERMEQTTFRDPRIVAALNDRFIPLKINGLDEPTLTSRLGISLYPTLILANSDGRIWGQQLVGFQEADALYEQLQRLLASQTPSETMKRDFENAVKWEANGDFARAITALRSILEDGKGAALQKDAGELMQKIDRRANERLAAAKALYEKGQPGDALEALTDVLRIYPGLAASKEAADYIAQISRLNEGARTAQRTKRVRELLAQAQDFYKSKDYIPCLDRCEIILSNFGDLPEGQQAFALVAEIKNNPEWLQAAADVMTDRLGGVYLALADSYLKRGDTQKAQVYLQRVMQAFPGSRLAESAQIRMSQLRGVTPMQKGAVESARP
jgi:thioredoxin-like negative regulator of GroEL